MLLPVLFGFRPLDFDDDFSALLVDQFDGTTTRLSLQQPSTITFTITADPASAAADRFYIVFKKRQRENTVALKGSLDNNDIALNWKHTDEDASGNPHYAERSTDGIHFSTVASRPSGAVTGRDTPGEWIDINPQPGKYYYRIRFAEGEEKTRYSNIVEVVKNNLQAAPGVFPNPVRNGMIGLQLGQLPAGIYQVKLINSAGQLLYKTNISQQNTATTQLIDVGETGAHGMCELEILSGNKRMAVIKVWMQ